MLSKAFGSPFEELEKRLNEASESTLKHTLDNGRNWLEATCGKGKGYFIWTKPIDCEMEPHFAKELVCNKEWCTVCGEDNSLAHDRRWLHWLPKIRQIKSMGYLVFTVPEGLRDNFRTKNSLSEFENGVSNILKDEGYDRQLRRIHFFGDTCIHAIKGVCEISGQKCPKDHADNCKDFVNNGKWHPHLNVLFEGAWISRKKLRRINRKFANKIHAKGEVVVSYEYTDKPGKMIHILKYVTRATFHDYHWDEKMAMEIRRWRNMRVTGQQDKRDKITGEVIEKREWRDYRDPKGRIILDDKDAAWSMDDLDIEEKEELENIDIDAIMSLGSGLCPGIEEECCENCNHRELQKWSQALPLILLKDEDKTAYGAGYYLLNRIKANGCHSEGPPGEEIKEYWLMLARGYIEKIKDHAQMRARRLKYKADLESLGIKEDPPRRKHRFGPLMDYDPYWDDPESEGFIEWG